jgi:hypothetical protein
MAYYRTDRVVKDKPFGEWRDPFWEWGASPYRKDTIGNNQIKNPDLEDERTLLFIKNEGDTWTGPWTLKRDDHHVITPNGGGSTPDGNRPIFRDVEAEAQAVHNRLMGHPPEEAPKVHDDAGDKAIQIVVAVASSILGGLSTGFSTMGTGYAASSGIFAIAAGLLGPIGGDRVSGESPPPPNIQQIESAIHKVTDARAARDAAIHFAESYDWFHNMWKVLAATKDEPPEHLEYDLNESVEHALNSSDHNSFAYTLASVRQNPSICYYILPHYMLATGLFLTLSRIHFLRTYFPKAMKKKSPLGVVPPEAIEPILEDAKQLRTGLVEAQEHFYSERNSQVQESRLNRTPEAIVPIKVFTKHFFGDEYAVRDYDYAQKFPKGSDFLANVTLSLKDSTGANYTLPKVGQGFDMTVEGLVSKPDPIEHSLAKLDTIVEALEEDLETVKKGGWPYGLLNIHWDVAA